MTTINYKEAGVDIQAGNEAVAGMKKAVESTFSPNVLTELGGFGAMYDLKEILQRYEHPVLVQSIDGVGTKTVIARMMNQFDTIGIDVVSATANDIIVLGATPLTLLDYIANDKLNPDIVVQIVSGMALACRENGISLVGGETAEMPGVYSQGEHDVVGVVTGIVDRDKAILGCDIEPGDVLLGLSSNGLHTNGYSLARKLFFDVAKIAIDTWHPELCQTVGEALLKPHLNYTRPILHLLQNGTDIKGMVHITGGGFIDNIPRVLPDGCAVEIDKSRWDVPPIFRIMQMLGNLCNEEMFRTFNMGIGFIIIVSEKELDKINHLFYLFPEIKVAEIGRVISSHQKAVRFL